MKTLALLIDYARLRAAEPERRRRAALIGLPWLLAACVTAVAGQGLIAAGIALLGALGVTAQLVGPSLEI